MLILVKRVGTNFGVLDTDDGALDWVSKSELLEYAKKVKIDGVSDNSIEPVSTSLSPSKCNWSNGNNIFKYAKKVIVTVSNTFIIVTEQNKRFKGVIDTDEKCLNFNNNIKVVLSDKNMSLLLGKDDESINALIINFRAGIM